MDLKKHIRIVPDFPKEGILFKDITPLLAEGEALRYATKELAKLAKKHNVEMIVGPEARGFVVGTALAYELGVGFIPVRKPGKLPSQTVKATYELEYGQDTLEMHLDAIKPGQKVMIVDDLLATGGTIRTTVDLVEKLGGQIACIGFLIELTYLDGRKKLEGYNIEALMKY